jgi:threonine dehydrogenase-like Zn-dependent dehydrogenase
MSGKYNLCPERLGLGYQKDGAFAEFVKVPAIRLHKLPDNVSFEEGALSEPCSVCYHALVDIAHIKPGESIAIIGPGPIGLLSLQIAKIQGARIILVSGTKLDKERLSLAKKLGAEVTVNISEEDPVKKVMEITNGFGCDIVIETSGAALARTQAIDMVRKGGKIVLIGHGAGKAEVNLDPLVYKEIAMLGSWSHVWEDWENVLKLMAANYINVKSLINKFPLNEWKKAFEAVEMKKVVKAILIP